MTSGDLNDLFKDPLSKYCLSLRCWGEDVAVRFWGTHNTTCQKLSDVNPAFSLNSKHQGRRTSHSGSSLSSPPTVHIQNKTKGTRFHRHVPPSNTPHTARPRAGSAPSGGLAPPPMRRYPRAELMVGEGPRGYGQGGGDAWAVWRKSKWTHRGPRDTVTCQESQERGFWVPRSLRFSPFCPSTGAAPPWVPQVSELAGTPRALLWTLLSRLTDAGGL